MGFAQPDPSHPAIGKELETTNFIYQRPASSLAQEFAQPVRNDKGARFRIECFCALKHANALACPTKQVRGEEARNRSAYNSDFTTQIELLSCRCLVQSRVSDWVRSSGYQPVLPQNPGKRKYVSLPYR
jgi:hypothetical protein